MKALTLKDSYKKYKEEFSKNSKSIIEYKLYRSICEDFNKELMNSIILEGELFKIPYRLGHLRIKKRKINIKNLKYDYGIYNKEDLKNKHLNEHSGNYYVRFYWNKVMNVIKNKTAYCFIPTRANKRNLASIIKQEGSKQINKYFE